MRHFSHLLVTLGFQAFWLRRFPCIAPVWPGPAAQSPLTIIPPVLTWGSLDDRLRSGQASNKTRYYSSPSCRCQVESGRLRQSQLSTIPVRYSIAETAIPRYTGLRRTTGESTPHNPLSLRGHGGTETAGPCVRVGVLQHCRLPLCGRPETPHKRLEHKVREEAAAHAAAPSRLAYPSRRQLCF